MQAPPSNRALETSLKRTLEKPLQNLHTPHSAEENRCFVLCVSSAAFSSPVSSTIYLPSLDTLAIELNASDTLSTLTLTSLLFRWVRNMNVLV